jgi:hypothetical protein
MQIKSFRGEREFGQSGRADFAAPGNHELTWIPRRRGLASLFQVQEFRDEPHHAHGFVARAACELDAVAVFQTQHRTVGCAAVVVFTLADLRADDLGERDGLPPERDDQRQAVNVGTVPAPVESHKRSGVSNANTYEPDAVIGLLQDGHDRSPPRTSSAAQRRVNAQGCD